MIIERSPVWKEYVQGHVERTFQTEIILSTEADGVEVCARSGPGPARRPVWQEQRAGGSTRGRDQRDEEGPDQERPGVWAGLWLLVSRTPWEQGRGTP